MAIETCVKFQGPTSSGLINNSQLALASVAGVSGDKRGQQSSNIPHDM